MKKLYVFSFFLLTLIPHGLLAQWKPLTFPDGGNVRCFALKDSDIYAGTGGGLYVSRDNGKVWHPIPNGLPNYDVYSIAVNGNDMFVGTGRGLFRSRDNAVSWQLLDNGLFSIGTSKSIMCNDSVIVTGTISINYLSTNNGDSWKQLIFPTSAYLNTMIMDNNTIVGGLWSEGICTSADYGHTWDIKNKGLPFYFNTNALLKKNDTIYAGGSDGVYASLDHCETWKKMDADLPSGLMVYSLTSIGNVLYAGTDKAGLYKSIDGGKSWTSQNTGIDQGAIVWSLQVKGKLLFAGTNNGIYISEDNGTTWIASNKGIAAQYIKKIEVFGDTICVGTFLSGAFFSYDNGLTWKRAKNGMSVNSIVYSFIQEGNTFYAATSNGVQKSTDGGMNWIAVNNGLPANNDGGTVYSLAVRDKIIFALLSDGIYQSNDFGTSWSSSLKIAKPFGFRATPTRLYAATDKGVFFYDEGVTNFWKTTSKVVSQPQVNKLVVLGNDFYASNLDGIYKSSNEGDSWTQTNFVVPPYNSYYFFESFNNILFTGFYSELFSSVDYGNTWGSEHDNLPICPITDILKVKDIVYAGTGGNGIWYTPLGEILGISENVSNENLIIYPNPSNGIFQIYESQSKLLNQVCELDVINTMGECAYHTIAIPSELDLHNQPKGMYVIRIRFKNGACENHKVIVQ